MALTVTVRNATVMGNMRVVTAQVTFDDSYPAGGESLSAGKLGLSSIDQMIIDPYDAASGRLVFSYDYANSKLQAFFPTGGASGATSLADPVVATPSGSTAVTSSSAQPNMTVTGGRGIEVGATANLSTMILRVTAIGQ